MIVRYLADIWKSFLRPETFFEMEDGDLWERYVKELDKPTGQQDERLIKKGRLTWTSMSDVKGGSLTNPMIGMLTEGFMASVIEAGIGDETANLFMAQDDHAWTDYCLLIEMAFDQHVGDIVFQGEDQRHVRTMWDSKWRFVKEDQTAVHYQRPLPMLTVNVIEGLAQAMACIPKALTEVSNITFE